MPDPLIGLDSERASVQPGAEARITVTITNTGTLVEGYQVQVLGPVAAWTRVDPPEVSVYPQQSASVALVFSPPSGTGAPAGTHRFRVVANSTLDPRFNAAAVGDLEIAKVVGLQAKVIPVTSSGRWRGRHTIHLTNWGNSTAQLRMTASDPDEALGFYLSPQTVSLPPGGRATVRLSARARRPFLRGTTVRLPFEVVGQPLDAEPGPPPPGLGYGDPSRPVAAAAFTQKPIVSAGLVKVSMAVLVALVGLGLFLFFRPRPVDELAARNAPARPVLTVTAAGPTSVRVRWDPVESADAYHLQRMDGATGDAMSEPQVFRELNSYEVINLRPAEEACFQLRASLGDVKGPWSGIVCATTESESPASASAAASTATPSSTWPPRLPLAPLRATRGSIIVDGNSGDWQWQQISRANNPVIGDTAATGDIYLMWDADALYLLAAVRDESLNPPDPTDPSRVYRGDAVILELGSDNRGLSAADLARPTDAYYMIGLASPGPVPSVRPTIRRFPTLRPTIASTLPSTPSATIGILGPNAGGAFFETPRDASQVTAAVTPSGDGYLLEARIPWATTGLNGIGPGATLAANVIVSDRKPDSMANLGMVSTNQQRSVELRAHPFYWQQLELLP